ncbi:MAG: N-acetylmuramoyl-L-alanine amidase family protein [Actinomycetes bacterium]
MHPSTQPPTRSSTRRGRLPRVAVLLALLVAVLLPLVDVASASASPAPAAAPSPLAGKVVAIDPGHQLGNSRHIRQINRKVWVGLWKPCNTTGTATNSGYPEATFTWRVATALRDRLEALGATVRMTRTANSTALWGPCVDARGRFGARVHADVEISLHGDGAASGTHGFFVIRPGLRKGYTDDIYAASRTFSTYVHGGLLAAGFRVSNAYGGDGYDVRRDLGTLSMADVPTVMVELGNMRNAGEARCMRGVACRARYAAGLTAGIRDYLRR